MTQTPNEKGFFVQFPIYLISSCPDLTRDDKWVLLSLMQDHRTEGPFKLSFRSISTISGVPLSLLSSYVDKKDVKHEGIMERIERVTGYLHCEMGKEIDPTTGKSKGNTQSYITINYTKIWQDNRLYSETKQNRPVSNTNTLFESVLNTIKPVSNTNGSVPIQNRVVSNTNEPVSNSRSEVPPYITEDNKITLDIEERESDVTPTSPLGKSPYTHSSSDKDSISLASSQGGVNLQPASDKGVSSHAPTNVAVGGTSSAGQHTLMQQSSENVACTAEHPIAILPDTAVNASTTTTEQQNVQVVTAAVQGYRIEEKHVDVLTVDANQDGNIPTGVNSETPDHVATNEACVTAMDEVKILTQEQMMEWVKGMGVQVSRRNAEKNKQTYTTLLKEGITSHERLEKLATEALHFYAEDDRWFGNLVEDRILKRLRNQHSSIKALPPKVDVSRMIDTILSEYPRLCVNPLIDADFGACVQLWYGAGQKDYWILRDLEDWESVKSDTDGMLKDALAYGEIYNLQGVK